MRIVGNISFLQSVLMKFIAIEFSEIRKHVSKSDMKKKKKKILSKVYILKLEKLNMHVLDIILVISQIINKITMNRGKKQPKPQETNLKHREILKVLKNG